MKRRRRSWKNVVWFCVFVLSVASVSHAVIDMNPAPFRTELLGDVEGEGLPPTTFQSWDFSVSEDLAADTGDTYNTYGTAVAAVGDNDVHYNTHNYFQGVWELNDGISVTVPNNQELNDIKNVWLQLTYMGIAPDITVDPLGGNTVNLIPVGDPEPLFGGWYQAAYKAQILPNPYSEIFHISPGADPTGAPATGPLYIDGMIIETECIPEPASLLVMSLGALIVRGRLRKKKVLNA